LAEIDRLAHEFHENLDKTSLWLSGVENRMRSFDNVPLSEDQLVAKLDEHKVMKKLVSFY